MLEFQEIGMEEASRVNVVTRNQSSSQEAYMEEETFTPRLSVFTPQPNAFSEALSQNREGNSISYFARKRSVDQGPLPPTDHALEEARLARTDGAILEDKAAHEAIMKQSLDTLLSCAAAAKALARNPPSNFHPSFSVTHRQLGSERDLAAADTAKVSGAPRSMTPSEYCTKSRAASSMANSFVLEEPSKYTKTKRRASQRTGSRERASKKTKSQPGHVEDLLYPTLMTWAMGAGIVVLVSAISFSAGYAIGVEVGQAEVLSRASDGAAHGVTCGQEVMKGGLRRLRWSSTAARFSSAA